MSCNCYCSDWCGVNQDYCCEQCVCIDRRLQEEIIRAALPTQKPRRVHRADPEEVYFPGPAHPIPEYKSVYELTLTTTKDDPYELREFLRKVCRSKMYNVVHWKACFELTGAGLPHIHAILYSSNEYCDGTKIKALKFPYRYEFQCVRNLAAYNNYIIKEENNIDVSIYCQAKGIKQIFDAGTEE